MYFDTAELESYLGAARGRRRRWKVRTRSYLDAAATWLEVKTRGARGQTTKRRRSHPHDQQASISPDDARFVDELLQRPGLGAGLVPTLMSEYRRMTLRRSRRHRLHHGRCRASLYRVAGS